MKYSKADKAEALKRLGAALKPGDEIKCILRSVSRSGMSRVISFYIVKDDDLCGLDWPIAVALGYPLARDGVKVGGCGMDMGFAVVYNVGRVTFPKGCALKHSPRKEQEKRAGQKREQDGGYALRSRWL